jgi:hypothetical protein
LASYALLRVAPVFSTICSTLEAGKPSRSWWSRAASKSPAITEDRIAGLESGIAVIGPRLVWLDWRRNLSMP